MMVVNLSIKEVPEATAERLRARAERHHRSLQGELLSIVEQAVAPIEAPAPMPVSSAPARQGWKTIEELVAERLARPLKPAPGLPLAVDIVRADRDNR
jgi:antitoxin FitA